jgi:hypothetical protein
MGRAMSTLTTRQKLLSYLADADESRINALYTLLEGDIQKGDNFQLSDEQFALLEEEREKHLSGETKSYTRAEAMDIIRRKRDF